MSTRRAGSRTAARSEPGAPPAGARRAGLLSQLLGLAPVPVAPHVFEVDATALRYGAFSRHGGAFEVERLVETELPEETFQAGPLGGPLRGREGFDYALERLLALAEAAPAEASLVLPDRWLRMLFTDLEQELGTRLDEDVLRFKLKKLVPFRVEDLRLRAAVMPAFPGRQDGRARLLLAFAIEQLVRELEAAFLARGVRIGQVASRSLYLISLVRDLVEGGVLLVSLEPDGYCLCHLAGGVPYVVRYRALQVEPGDPDLAGNVAQDLRILLGFLEQHLPEHGVDQALLCGAPESTAPWLELLRDRFALPCRALDVSDLPVVAPPASMQSHRVAPLLAAAGREVA